MKIDNSSRIVIRVNMNFEVNDEEKKKLRRMLMRDFVIIGNLWLGMIMLEIFI